MSVSVRGHGFVREQKVHVDAYDTCKKAGKCGEDFAIVEKKHTVRTRGAMNTTKHLWSGAIAAMVSRSCFICSPSTYRSCLFHYKLVNLFVGVSMLLVCFISRFSVCFV